MFVVFEWVISLKSTQNQFKIDSKSSDSESRDLPSETAGAARCFAERGRRALAYDDFGASSLRRTYFKDAGG